MLTKSTGGKQPYATNMEKIFFTINMEKNVTIALKCLFAVVLAILDPTRSVKLLPTL